MPIDPSIPLQVQVPQVNGLAMLGTIQQNQLRRAQLQQLQQQMGANAAASQALQGAIGPDGQIDMAKFSGALQGTPYAYNIPEYAAKVQALTNSQLENKTKAFDLRQKELNFWNGQLGGLVALGDKVQPKNVLQSLANAVQSGQMTPDQAQQYAMQIPSNPQELSGWVRNHWISLQSAKDQAALLNPQVQMVDTGSGVNIVPINPQTGQVAGNITSLQKSLSPGEAAQRVTVFDPKTGQQGTVSLGSTVGQSGGAAAGNGFLPTTAPMGQDKIAGAAADRFNALTDAAGRAPTSINGYSRALEALDAAGMSGPAADAALFLPTMLQSLGIQSEGGTVENFQSLKKYLANAGSQAAASAGYSGSDARLSSFTQGQPDPKNMNPGALRGAIQYVMALESGVVAKNNAAQEWLAANGGNTAKLPEFERRWSNAFNPDVMELRNLPPDQQQAYVAALKPEKRKALMDSYRKMSNVGAF